MDAASTIAGPFERLPAGVSAAGAAPRLRLFSDARDRLLQPDLGLVVTPNLDHLRLLAVSRAFRRAYAQADVVLNDSRFLDRLALRGRALCLPGSELAPELLEVMAAQTCVAIVGGDEEMRSYLRDAFPRLRFTFVQPSMGYIRKPGERRRLANAVLDAEAAWVFVCTGAPQSELFAAQLKRAGCRATILCCGSAFHFMSGVQQRAPAMLRTLGAEWAWRFMREGRTRRRYAADAAFLLRRLPAFLALRRRGSAGFGAFTLQAG